MFNYDNIPQELKELQRWVLWKKRKLENGKFTKVPVNAKNGYGAKSNDKETWTTFDEAYKKISYYNCDGLGFMLGNGYFGIDIDHALDDTELINEFVETMNSYTELSQSGEGIHIICKGVLPQGARRKGNIEMYDNARFFVMTGNLFDNKHTSIFDRTNEVKQLWNKHLNDNVGASYVYKKNIVAGGLTDEEVIEKAKESQNGNLFTCLYYGQWEGIYPSQSEADMSFCSLLAFWCGKNEEQIDRIFRTSGLMRDKWNQKRGVKTYGEITIETAIAKCKDVYNKGHNDSQVYNPITGEVTTKKDYDFNDTGNARRFVDRFGNNLRYNFDNKCWMIFNGKTWVVDNKQIVKTQADLMIEEMKIEALQEKDKELQKEMLKNIKHLSSSNGKEAMLKEAMHIGEMPTVNSDYNRDNYLLNCFNGVVDLRTGQLLKHDKKYMISRNTDLTCDMEKEPTRWLQFLKEVFGGNDEMVDYIHKVVGYTLTGDTREHIFFQCYGSGANGKSVFLDILYYLLGDYSLNTQVESILARSGNNGGATSEIARMEGSRFIRTNEPNEGARFNEGLIKQLVSGDVTTARFLYGREFEFVPKGKLWIATNYKIGVRGMDDGIWRRMRLIPFEEKFVGDKADKNLPEKLMNELPQILGWAVKGAIKWQKEGLKTVPKKISDANEEYKQEMDTISTFMNDCTRLSTIGRERASDVYREYAEWAKIGHENCMTQSKFGIEMAKRYQKKTINGYVYYLGFVLKKHDESYVFERDVI